jgi:hypothetical protein
VRVWCAVAAFGVWGPYFFEEDELTVTVTSNRYCHMIETFPPENLQVNDTEADIYNPTLPPSMSRLSRQCGILNITHLHRPPQPVTGIALLFVYILNLIKDHYSNK